MKRKTRKPNKHRPVVHIAAITLHATPSELAGRVAAAMLAAQQERK